MRRTTTIRTPAPAPTPALTPALTLALTLAVALAAAAHAQGAGPDAVELRQTGFDLMNGDAAAMKAAISARQDPAPFEDDADAMARWGRLIPSLFPPGTETGHDTKARPEGWSDRAGFVKAAADFTAASEKLSEAAKSGDADAFAARFKDASAACGACHKAYKQRAAP